MKDIKLFFITFTPPVLCFLRFMKVKKWMDPFVSC